MSRLVRSSSVLVLAAALLAPASAAAQDAVALLRRDTLDWPRAWEAAMPRPTKAGLLRLGMCETVAEAGERYFHHVDADGDGRADLVYSGPSVFCNANAEGTVTRVYLSRGDRLVAAFEGFGHVVGLSRPGPWQPVTLVLRANGCCADPYFSLATYVPRRAAQAWSWEAATELVGTSATELPRATLAAPRPFTVAQDRYHLRTKPVVDDDVETTFEMEERQGNVQASFARGSRGIALAERRDATGRTWWFVVMQSPAIGAEPPQAGRAPGWHVGWMSSRFLTPDAAVPSGRIDRLPSVEFDSRP